MKKLAVRICIGGWVLATLLSSAAVTQSPDPQGEVLFVCEHGSVKSLMAATFFNRLAVERGLRFRAYSRGIIPDEHVPERIAEALAADGADVKDFKPQRVVEADTRRAIRVVAINVDPSKLDQEGGSVERWDDIPASTNYPAARSALLKHIEALLEELNSTEQARRP